MNPPLPTSALSAPAREVGDGAVPPPRPGVTAADAPLRQMERDVFVCYSRADMAVVDRILKELAKRGRSIWIDREGIAGSEAWRAKIVESLRCCRAVLFFGSRSSYASKHVATELALAEREQKPIIPVALDDSHPDGEMLFLLVRLHELRVRANDDHLTVSEIETALQNIGFPESTPEPHTTRRDAKRLPLFGVALGIACAGGLGFAMRMWSDWHPARVTDPPAAHPSAQIAVAPSRGEPTQGEPGSRDSAAHSSRVGGPRNSEPPSAKPPAATDHSPAAAEPKPDTVDQVASATPTTTGQELAKPAVQESSVRKQPIPPPPPIPPPGPEPVAKWLSSGAEVTVSQGIQQGSFTDHNGEPLGLSLQFDRGDRVLLGQVTGGRIKVADVRNPASCGWLTLEDASKYLEPVVPP